MPFESAPHPDEVLSRFIFSRGQFSPAQMRVKADAFLPSPLERETSVFRTVGLDREAVRGIGEMVGSVGGRSLRAWGNVGAGVVFEIGLDVRPDNVPERHAAIVGWPTRKDEQISLAQRLAAAATLQLPP